VDLLLNIHSLYVTAREILQTPKIGCFNLHPFPLLRYAGLNPVCWALYDGETTHGVTLHGMTAEIDAGPFWLHLKRVQRNCLGSYKIGPKGITLARKFPHGGRVPWSRRNKW